MCMLYFTILNLLSIWKSFISIVYFVFNEKIKYVDLSETQLNITLSIYVVIVFKLWCYRCYAEINIPHIYGFYAKIRNEKELNKMITK